MLIIKSNDAAHPSLAITPTVKRIWSGVLIAEQFHHLRREVFWIITGQVTAILGSLVGIRMLTGVLSPRAYGELALGMTAAMLVNQIVLGPLSNASLRFFAPAQEAGEFPSFLLAVRGLLLRATAIMVVIASIICLSFVLLGQLNWIWLSAAAFGFAAISGYNSVLDGMQNAARQRAIVAWHGALASWGRFLGAVGLVILLGANSAIAMLGYMLASMLVLLSQGWFVKRRLLPPNSFTSRALADRRRWESEMFAYAWPFASWGIFTWMQMASERWALQIFASTKQVGLYTVLYQLGYYPITILTGVVVQLVMPIFFQYAGHACDTSRTKYVHALIWRLTLASLIMTGASVIVALAMHGFVFRLLVAPEYQSVSWLLPGMVLSSGIFATGQFASLSIMSNRETRNLLKPKIGSAVIGVALNLLGAAWFAVPGVVGASIVFSGIYSVWVYRLTRAQ